MNDIHYLPLTQDRLRTFVFRAVVEPQETRWTASCPALADYGAIVSSTTQDGALRLLQGTVERIIGHMLARGEPIPEDVLITSQPLISVTSA